MSSYRRTNTRGRLLRDSRAASFTNGGFLEPLVLDCRGTRIREVSRDTCPSDLKVPLSPEGAVALKSPRFEICEGIGITVTAPEDVPGEEVPRQTFRQKAYHTLNGKVDSPIEYFVLFLIFCNVIMFMAGTVWLDRKTGEISCVTLESDDESKCIQLNTKYPEIFDTFEIFSMGVFTVEYFIRLYSCVEDPVYSGSPWWSARFKWIFSIQPIIDLAAIIPTWIECFVEKANYPGFGILRIARLGRLVSAQDYIDAYSIIRDVAIQNKALLIVSGWYGILALVFFSSVLYYTEMNWEGDSGVVFASIPKGMFATALFLTGEFTLDELSPAGEFFALVACLGTIGMITIPVTVLAAGFIEKIQDQNFRKQYLMYNRRSTVGTSYQAKSWNGVADLICADDTNLKSPKVHTLSPRSPQGRPRTSTAGNTIPVEDRLTHLEEKIDLILETITKSAPIE